MNDLETYIREHAAQFDTAEPASGHEERFLARVDATPQAFHPEQQTACHPEQQTPCHPEQQTPCHPERSEGSSFRRPRYLIPLFALAALAVALVVFRPGTSHHFLGVPNNPERVYRSYLAQVEKAYLTFPWEDGYDWESALDELTEESVSLYEQLPDGLSPRRQARILKAYYGDLLDGVQQLKNR